MNFLFNRYGVKVNFKKDNDTLYDVLLLEIDKNRALINPQDVGFDDFTTKIFYARPLDKNIIEKGDEVIQISDEVLVDNTFIVKDIQRIVSVFNKATIYKIILQNNKKTTFKSGGFGS